MADKRGLSEQESREIRAEIAEARGLPEKAAEIRAGVHQPSQGLAWPGTRYVR